MTEEAPANLSKLKQRLWDEIDHRRDRLAQMCAESLKVPAENPPGDTTAVANHYEAILAEAGLSVERFEPRSGNPILVSSLSGRENRPRFVFSGHLDHFPADDPALWSFPPYGGQIRDGKILGRASGDMRGGLTASLFSFLLIHELGIPLRGPLTIELVSDEETGGRWGTDWLLRTRPELAGDACIIGEPGGPDGLTIGEKGRSQFRLIADAESYHGGLAAGDDVIIRIGAALQVVRRLVDLGDNPPADLLPVLEARANDFRTEHEKGRGWLLRRPSVAAGVIKGGIKVNVVPRHCEVEIDCRVPFGLSPQRVREFVEQGLAEAGLEGIRFEFMPPVLDACYTSPTDLLVQRMKANVVAANGIEPRFAIEFGSTDARYFRPRGVPTVIYGPRSHNMAARDEFITIDDLVAITKVHLATALDYLLDGNGQPEHGSWNA
jgi:succinyl-diaminopimelate desuccinylase